MIDLSLLRHIDLNPFSEAVFVTLDKMSSALVMRQVNSLSVRLFIICHEKQVLNTWPYGEAKVQPNLYVVNFKSGRPRVKWKDITAVPNFKALESTN